MSKKRNGARRISRRSSGNQQKSATDTVTGLNLGQDSGTWVHSNAGYKVLSSQTSARQLLAGGYGQPVFLDTNKNGYHNDKGDYVVGSVIRPESLTFPLSDADMHSGTWNIGADGKTGSIYFGNGTIAGYMSLSVSI